jgi:uncharacterized protein
LKYLYNPGLAMVRLFEDDSGMFSRLRTSCVSIFVAWSFVGATAWADCGTSAAPLDKLICDTPELAAKDRALDAKYQAAMALLSDVGKQRLREAERRWLAMVGAYCGTDVGKSEDGSDGPVNCLSVQYDERLAQLDRAAQKVGPYIIGRIEEIDFLASAPDDNYGSRKGLSYRDYSRPYIDSPVNAETTRWNEMIKQLADGGEADVASMYASDDYSAEPTRLPWEPTPTLTTISGLAAEISLRSGCGFRSTSTVNRIPMLNGCSPTT